MRTLTSSMVAGALLSGFAQAADVSLMQLPESPGWQHGRAFVAAYNNGDRAAIVNYLSTRLAPRALAQQSLEARAQELLRLRAQLGPAEVQEVSGTPSALILNLSGAEGDADIVLIVDDDHPERLVALRAVASEAPVQVRASRILRNGGAL